VQDVRNRHSAWLQTVDDAERVNALCELNVVEQALNVCRTTVVREAWQRGQDVVVHGWVYRLHNGLLQDLTMTVGRLDDAVAVYEEALAAVHARYAEPPASG
jgi:carbonic anhydrase